jgi:hypothetical protein
MDDGYSRFKEGRLVTLVTIKSVFLKTSNRSERGFLPVRQFSKFGEP